MDPAIELFDLLLVAHDLLHALQFVLSHEFQSLFLPLHEVGLVFQNADLGQFCLILDTLDQVVAENVVEEGLVCKTELT